MNKSQRMILVFLVLISFTFSSIFLTSTFSNAYRSSNYNGKAKLNYKKSSKSTTSSILSPQATTPQAWTNLGPQPIDNSNGQFTWGQAPFSGRVTAIAVNASDTSNIYIGAAQGGVWKTTDNGVTWTPLTDNETSLATGAITLSPDQKTVYVGTGEPNWSGDSYVGSGILKSTDGGLTWTLFGANEFNNSAISAIVVFPNNPNRILVSSTAGVCCNGYGYYVNSNGDGIYLSTDGGITWTQVYNSLDFLGVSDIVLNTTNTNFVYASTFNGSLYGSPDMGVTWYNLLYYSTSVNQGRVDISYSPNTPNLIYDVYSDSNGEIISVDSFDPFTLVDTSLTIPTPPPSDSQAYGPCNGQCSYDLYIKVDPINAQVMYIGGIDVFKSVDGGTTWSDLGGSITGSYFHTDQHAFAFDPANPNVIYIGNDGGVWSTSNGGSSWSNLNTNLSITQFSSIDASPASDNTLIGGTQDNACVGYKGTNSWTELTVGDGGYAAFEHSNPQIQYCMYPNLNFQRSTDGGVTWSYSTTGINLNDPSAFYPPTIQDPNTAGTLFIGSNRIYKSTNYGASWSDISGSITSSSVITALAIAPSNSIILYEGNRDGTVEKSVNGGVSWNLITNSYTTPVNYITVDPHNSSIVYVVYQGQSGPRLVYSQDAGLSWYVDSLNGVPKGGINVMKINPNTGTKFLGTDNALYYDFNNTGIWSQLGKGLAKSAIFDLTFTKSNYLVVATHGRGVWENLMTPVISLSSPSNNAMIKSGTTISVSVTDPNGLHMAQYQWDSGSQIDITGSFQTTEPTGDGTHTLTINAVDVAGNLVFQVFTFQTNDTTTTPSNPNTGTPSGGSPSQSPSGSTSPTGGFLDAPIMVFFASMITIVLFIRKRRYQS